MSRKETFIEFSNIVNDVTMTYFVATSRSAKAIGFEAKIKVLFIECSRI